eukprot:jgi/Chlat1/4862/Chrsp31S00374
MPAVHASALAVARPVRADARCGHKQLGSSRCERHRAVVAASRSNKPLQLSSRPFGTGVLCANRIPTSMGGTSPDLVAQRKFRPLPNKPNWVSSQADPSDKLHYFAPLTYSGDVATARKKLEDTLKTFPRVQIERSDGNYLHAVFTSMIMRFKDDVEFLFSDGTLHVQSSSRVGYGDMGVNRKRMNSIKDKWTSA